MYMRKNAVRGQLYSGFSPSVSQSLRLNSGHQASQQVPLVLNHLTGLVSQGNIFIPPLPSELHLQTLISYSFS